jgi:hypothetical protein
MTRPHFSPAVNRELRDRAGNRCSNPSCRRATSGPAKIGSGATNLGVASHVCAAMPGGPRYNPDQDESIRHSIDNGIWLCEICAAMIDKNDGAGFPVPLLMGWKGRAEESARAALEGSPSGGSISMPEIQAVSYVNIPRLIDMGARRGFSTNWPVIAPGQWLHDLGFETRQAMNAASVLLEALSVEAVPLNVAVNSDVDASGLIVAFQERLFTKNGPRLEDQRRGKVYPFDSWAKAPHLHKRIGARKFVLVYDPRWLTATTAFVEVTSGQTTFAGLAVLKTAHPSDETIIASPIIMGWPKPLFDIFEEFRRHGT